MRYRSETWSKLAARGQFQMETKARIANKDYTAISAPVISRSLMSSPLSVGNCTSATLSLSILTDDDIIAANPITILGRLTSDGQYSEWLEFGTFYINQRDTSYEGLVSVECYDAMLKANQDYLSSEDSTADWPKTMKEVVEEIAYRIGVGIDPRTRIKTGSDYVVSAPTEKTMVQVLGYIGACHGGNWIITEDNLLRLVPLIPIADESFHIIDADYNSIKASDGSLLAYQLAEETEASAEDGGTQPESVIKTVHRITDEQGQPIVTADGYCLIWAEDGQIDAVYGLINVPVVCGELTKGTNVTITGVTASDESGTNFETGDDSGYQLSIESNPYMTQKICDDLCVAFEGLIYEPYTATKACYDPATELGDQVKIGDKVRSVLYSANIRLDLDFRSDMSAPNSEELSEEYPYPSAKEDLKKTTIQLKSYIKTTESSVSRLDVLEEQISTKVSSTEVEKLISAQGEQLGQRITDAETSIQQTAAELTLQARTEIQQSGQNLIVQACTSAGYRLNENGNPYETEEHTITDYIDVIAGNSYTLTAYAAKPDGTYYLALAWYTADKTFLSRPVMLNDWGAGDSSTQTAPDDAAYARLSFPTSLIGQIRLEWGTVSSTGAPESVSAKLELKVDKSDNDQVVSMLNASADEINITGNRLVIQSDNFTLAADGTMTAANGSFRGKIAQTGTSTDEDGTTTYQDELTIENGQIKTTGNVYTGRNFAFTRAYDIVRTIFAQWADGSNHDVLRLRADGLTMALGWAGSSSYLTKLILYGQTIAAEGNMTVDGNLSVSGSLSTYGLMVPRILHGSLSVTVEGGSSIEFGVLFPTTITSGGGSSTTFPGIPNVVITLQHDSTVQFYYRIKKVSATGFDGYVYNPSSNSLSPTIQWIAMYG